MPDHPQLGQGKGDKDVDAVEHHQQRDRAVAEDHHHHRGRPHQEHAVLGDQSIAQGGKARGEPTIQGHVGQNLRPAHEPGLRGDHEQRRLRHQGHQHEAEADLR